MSSISEAIIAGYKAARSVAGISAIYTRPAVGSVTLTAVPGDSVHETTTSSGFTTETKSQDYLFLVSELVISGSEITPLRGDTVAAGGKTYDVLAIGGETHWRYGSPAHVVIRVHCKQ